MSGQETEPLTAFFPSIDRSLMRDLERHLRHGEGLDEPAASGHAPSAPPEPEPSAPGSRVDISSVLEAVEHAASSMNAMADRIQELEAHNQALETHSQALQTQIHELAAQVDEATRHRDALSANLKAEAERVNRLESLAAHHVSRSTGLERDLGVARADLAKIVDAITNALGAPMTHTE